jgi:hypothetical protein
MNGAFQFLIPIALAAVVIVLLLGLFNMMRGGSSDRSQKLMRLRVMFQFVALCLMMAALYFSSH